MKRVGILFHPMIEGADKLAKKLQKSLDSRGVSVWLCSAWEEEEIRTRVNNTDLILTLGGDGTILRAVQAAVPRLIPVTGINLGRLGFMAELSVDEAHLTCWRGKVGLTSELCLRQSFPIRMKRAKLHFMP
jgi:NAD+ kinase